MRLPVTILGALLASTCWHGIACAQYVPAPLNAAGVPVPMASTAPFTTWTVPEWKQVFSSFMATTNGDATVLAAGSSFPRALSHRLAQVYNLADYEPPGTVESAICNGVHDETAAFNAAHAAALAATTLGATIKLPGGTCAVASPLAWTNAGSVSIAIAGENMPGTKLSFAGSGISETITAGGALSLHDLTLTGGGGAGTGLSIVYNTNSGEAPGGTSLERMFVEGNWPTQILLSGANTPLINFVHTLSSNGVGLHVTGTGPLSPGGTSATPVAYDIDAKITNSAFQNGTYPVLVDGYVQGMFITNSEALGGQHGFYWGYPGASYPAGMAPELLTLTNFHGNNHLDDVYTNGVTEIQVAGGLVWRFVPNGDTFNALDFENSSQIAVVGLNSNGGGVGVEHLVQLGGTTNTAQIVGTNAVFFAGPAVNITAGVSNVTMVANNWNGVSAGGVANASSTPASITQIGNTINGSSFSLFQNGASFGGNSVYGAGAAEIFQSTARGNDATIGDFTDGTLSISNASNASLAGITTGKGNFSQAVTAAAFYDSSPQYANLTSANHATNPTGYPGGFLLHCASGTTTLSSFNFSLPGPTPPQMDFSLQTDCTGGVTGLTVSPYGAGITVSGGPTTLTPTTPVQFHFYPAYSEWVSK